VKVKYFFFLLLVWIPMVSVAQTDSVYIGRYPQKVMLLGFMAYDFLNLSVEANNRDLMYMPNNPPKFGLGLALNNTILSFGYGYGFNFMTDKKYGETKSFDFQLHSYARQFAFDIFVQKYKGFYMEEKGIPDYVLCPDLDIRQYGGNMQYAFNNKKFSYKAAFSQSEKQLRSAGSFLVGAGIYLTHIKADSSFVHKEKTSLDNFQFGVSAGYTYTWVLGRRWFINGSVTTGINFGSEKISTFGKQRLEVYPTVFPRLAVGYNRENWALRFSYVNNITFPFSSDEETLGVFSGSFQLTYIHRVQDIPFLTRLVGWLPL